MNIIKYKETNFTNFKKDYKNLIAYKLNISENNTDLNQLLFGNPKELITKKNNGTLKISGFKTRINYDFITKNNESKATKNKFNFINYKTFRDRILDQLDVSVCPYCNRNYIDVFIDPYEGKFKKFGKGAKARIKRNKRSLAALDHYYPQAKYPYLSLNIFNFIPCCTTCNSKFKLAYSGKLLNPFDTNFDDICYFEVDTTDLPTILNSVDNANFEIKLKDYPTFDNLETARDNTKKLFRLEEIYNLHKSDAKNIIIKTLSTSDSYINDIQSELKQLTNYCVLDSKELLFGITEDLNNSPLSKFRKDIFNQFNNN